MQRRSAAAVIILSIITCGIYGLYWMCVTTNDMQRSLRNPDGSVSSGGLAVLFGIISCGIYTYYWWFKMGKKMAQLQEEAGQAPNDNSVVYLLLSIFGLSIINYALLQSAINTYLNLPVPPQGGGYQGGNGYPNNANNNGYPNYPNSNNNGYPNNNNNGNGYPNNNQNQEPPQNPFN